MKCLFQQTIFGIDSATGSVKVVGTVDRRQLKQVILPVRVVDLNAPSGSNQTDRGMKVQGNVFI